MPSSFGLLQQQYLMKNNASYLNFPQNPLINKSYPSTPINFGFGSNEQLPPPFSTPRNVPPPKISNFFENNAPPRGWSPAFQPPAMPNFLLPTNAHDLNGNFVAPTTEGKCSPHIPTIFEHQSQRATESPLVLPPNPGSKTYADILAEFHDGESETNDGGVVGEIPKPALLTSKLTTIGPEQPIQNLIDILTPLHINAQSQSRGSSAPEPLNYAMVVKRKQQNSQGGNCTPKNEQQKVEEVVAVAQSPSPQRLNKPPVPIIENNKENHQLMSKLISKNPTFVNGVNLNSLKFVKPAPQCPKWDKPKHRFDEPHCPLWHPRVICTYYPSCQLTAEICGYAHPFCGPICKCDPSNRSLQKNHNILTESKLKQSDMVQKPPSQNGHIKMDEKWSLFDQQSSNKLKVEKKKRNK